MRAKPNEIILKAYQNTMSKEELDDLKIALNVDKSYLEYAFELIEKDYGGFDAYFKEILCLPASYAQQFNRLYVK